MALLRRAAGRVQAVSTPAAEHAWSVGRGAVLLGDQFHGHDDSQFSPEEYGDYLVTSNEVYAAAMLRARLMSRLRLRLYRGQGPDKTEVTSGPAVDLLRRVNPFWTDRRLARMDELSMSVWGESHWVVERDRGVPREIWWVKPPRMTPVPHETGYLAGWLYESVTGEQIAFRADEVVWLRYPNPLDEFSALSPVAAARLAADTASAMQQANRNLFRNGLMAGGLVVPATDKVTFSKAQADELEEQLERRLKGVDKAHRWAVLRYEAQLKGLSVSPKDAEFVEGLGLTLRQVANAYGIPVPLLNDMSHATLANVDALQAILWENTLVPDADLRAAEIQEQFLPMFAAGPRTPDHVAYDYSSVAALQRAESEQWARERQAIDIGRKTINEVRRAAGEPPVPWGDVYWAPVNKHAVSGPDTAPPEGASGDGPSGGPESDPGRPRKGDEDDLSALLDPGLWGVSLNGRH